MLAGACGGGSFRYLTHRDSGTYMKVPDDWTVYGTEDTVAALVSGGDPLSTPDIRWAAAFDANPQPSLDHFFGLDATAKHPTGFVQVRTLSAQERDEVSQASLRNSILNIDENSQIEVLAGPVEVSHSATIDGQRVIFNIRRSNGFFTVDQTTLLDHRAGEFYLLMVGCEVSCFLDQRDVIDKLVTSWTIKKR
ncbi:MAG: hypothetical protein ACRD0F_05095 [Acidimicrobiales bacterium]